MRLSFIFLNSRFKNKKTLPLSHFLFSMLLERNSLGWLGSFYRDINPWWPKTIGRSQKFRFAVAPLKNTFIIFCYLSSFFFFFFFFLKKLLKEIRSLLFLFTSFLVIVFYQFVACMYPFFFKLCVLTLLTYIDLNSK